MKEEKEMHKDIYIYKNITISAHIFSMHILYTSLNTLAASKGHYLLYCSLFYVRSGELKSALSNQTSGRLPLGVISLGVLSGSGTTPHVLLSQI